MGSFPKVFLTPLHSQRSHILLQVLLIDVTFLIQCFPEKKDTKPVNVASGYAKKGVSIQLDTCHEKIQRQFTLVQSHDIHRHSSFIALMYLRLHAQSLVYSVKYHLYGKYESLITLHAVLPSNHSRVLPICLHVLTFA